MLNIDRHQFNYDTKNWLQTCSVSELTLGHLCKPTKTETNTILILSKAILCTGGLEALRAQINAAQIQKCFGLKDLPLAVRWRR